MEGARRPIWEWMVFITVIILTVVLMGATYAYQEKIDKQQAMHYQLQVLRTAELLYTSVNKAKPTNLQQLLEGNFQLPDDVLTRRFIEHPPALVGGKVLDPFGNAYSFDPASGWIKSTTPGYDFW